MANLKINGNLTIVGGGTLNSQNIATEQDIKNIGKTSQLLASMNDTGATFNLSSNLNNFSFVMLISRRSDEYRMPILIPVGYILSHQNVELQIEGWDGARYRIIFTSTTARISNGYYANPVEVWGIN